MLHTRALAHAPSYAHMHQRAPTSECLPETAPHAPTTERAAHPLRNARRRQSAPIVACALNSQAFVGHTIRAECTMWKNRTFEKRFRGENLLVVGRHFIFLQRDLQHLQGGKSTQVHAWPSEASQRPRQAKTGQGGASSRVQRPTKCLWRAQLRVEPKCAMACKRV